MAPLDGITVLDLTRVLSGPYCTMLLADMGARVIKIEQPGKGDDTRAWGPPFLKGESAYFMSINRNKESMTLDFKQPDGRAVLERLVAKADVLVENFRPRTLTKLGLDYQSLAAKHPRLIYCSVSGFGQTGPRSAQPGYDAVIQAEGGLMSITGPTDGPPYRVGVAIADIVSGMLAAYGVSMALFARERTGRGQQVDLAMLDAVTALLTYQAGSATGIQALSRTSCSRHLMVSSSWRSERMTNGKNSARSQASARTTSSPRTVNELFSTIGSGRSFRRRFGRSRARTGLNASTRPASRPARCAT